MLSRTRSFERGSSERYPKIPLVHELIEEAVEKVKATHGPQLAACEGLLDFVLDVARPWQGRPVESDAQLDPLLSAIVARSTNTYWSAIELCRIGFGDQAAMLNRS